VRLDIYIYPSPQGPLPEIYPFISGSEALRMASTDETEASDTEVAPAPGGIEVGHLGS